jgi:uncharacterized protein (TIGR03437 family)
MKKFISKFATITLILFSISAVFSPVLHAQGGGVTVSVSTKPNGIAFSVDGQVYFQPFSAVWPQGSKHVLSTDIVQPDRTQKAQYLFQSWAMPNGQLPPGNTITVTADPANPTFQATFTAQYALTLSFFGCPDPTHCASPGTIYIGGAPYISDTDVYLGAGSTVTLMAVPNSGYVFTGWAGGPNQNVQGMIDSVTLNNPVVVSPMFQVARKINLVTIPAGLEVLADRAMVPTPTTLEWGWGSVHSLSPVSPQEDQFGSWWAFSSWSDGGASTHAYTVANLSQPDTVTATYVPVAVTSILSQPAGLAIKVDGRTNWPSYNFQWGIGETHHLEAPAQQTDAQGRLWAFASWSNGGPAIQDFTVPSTAAGTGLHLVATYTPLGHLVVNSTLAGVTVKVDGSDCPVPCDIQRPVGTAVKVSATASIPLADGTRDDFSGWPGSGSTATDYSYTLNGDAQKVTIDFHLMNRLVTSSNPANAASWTMQPSSPDGYYSAQGSVVLTAAALPGFRFRNWNGDASGSSPSAVVAMNMPRSVQAVFDQVPYIAPAGVSNAAGVTPQAGVAPGSIVSIFGQNLGTTVTVGPTSPMAQTLGGTIVKSAGSYLPLFFVSPTQINVQLPDNMPTGQQTLTVSSQGLPDVQATFTVVQDAPGLFQQVVNGQSFAVALHADGTPVTTDSPATNSEVLTLLGTGFGPANPSRPLGLVVPPTPPYLLADPITIQVGSAVLTPVNAFVVPGQAGLDAVQFQLGSGAPSSTNAPLYITVNGQNSNSVLLPIQ